MAKVRVGVTRFQNGFEVQEVGAPGVELRQHWVELNGLRLDGGALGLMRVDYVPAPPGESPSENPAQVTITLLCEGFETVDNREEATDGCL